MRARLFAIVSTCALSAAAAPRLQFVSRRTGVTEIDAVDARGRHVLQRFAAPEEIGSSAVSRDGRFAFVWHHPDRSPRRLSFFDLAAMQETGEIAPGFGGDFAFTPAGHVVHTWGCGTNCAGWRVYDVRGRVVLGGWTSGAETSPDRRFAATFPSIFGASEPLAVYDLDAGRSIASLPSIGCVAELRWTRGRLFFTATDSAGRDRHGSVDLPR